ncbi:alpha/beta fold hydrolase [Planctomycetaceae bacterium SH139]
MNASRDKLGWLAALGNANSRPRYPERYLESNMYRCIAAFFVLVVFSMNALSVAADAASDTISSDGTSIAYKTFGSGPAVVFVHGLTGSQKDFAPLAKEFANAGFRAIVFDIRGHGASGKPHSPDAYGQQILRDIRNLLDHLSIDSAHIIGYSMGGDIANKFRELYPTRTLSCVIGGAGLGTTIGWADRPHDFNQIADSLKQRDGFVPLLRLPGAISPGVATDKEIAEVNAMMTKGNDTNALAALLCSYSSLELDPTLLASNQVRTLIVVGAYDAEYASSLELHEKLLHSQHCILDGLNHFEAWQHKKFADATTAFITGLDRTK